MVGTGYVGGRWNVKALVFCKVHCMLGWVLCSACRTATAFIYFDYRPSDNVDGAMIDMMDLSTLSRSTNIQTISSTPTGTPALLFLPYTFL